MSDHLTHLEWKQLLSIVRDGDYAHAGEETAIDLVFADIQPDPNRAILDVGCGIGGTADYVQKKGWGKVIGIDQDGASIEYAQKHYPNIAFHRLDVINVPKDFSKQFDLIYLFNAFYSFDDQDGALNSMHDVATPQATLLLFDYVNRGSYQDQGMALRGRPIVPYAIHPEAIIDNLKTTGWQLMQQINLDREYQHWYAQFVDRIAQKKRELIAASDESCFQQFQKVYQYFLEEITQGRLGGMLISAKAV